jgi:flagellar protein FlaG
MKVAPVNVNVTGAAPQPQATATGGTAETGSAHPVAAAAERVAQPAAVSHEQLDSATKAVNKFIEPHASNLEFQMDTQSGRTIMKLIDKETGSVLRQLPSEEMLAIARALDKLKGLVIQEKA